MTRHGSLADQLEALRRYATTPDHEPEPMQTNWSVTPANDNNPEDLAELKLDRLWDISPSPEEITRQTANKDAVEYGSYSDDNGKPHKVIVRWGTLRFSDGTQTEQGFKLSIDGDAVPAQIRMPIGAMLGTTDKERAQRGGDDNPQDVSGTNDYFAGIETEYRPAGLFKARFAGRVKRKARSERTGPKTKAEARQWLDDAIAGTATMPEVTKCPDGFPASPANLAQLFPSMVKLATGSSGSMAWQDIVSEREARREFFRWVAELKRDDKDVLDMAVKAGSMSDIGASIGFEGKRAERRGKRALIVANDNLMAAIKKYSA